MRLKGKREKVKGKREKGKGKRPYLVPLHRIGTIQWL
jgi:hypothetical protein